MANKLNHRVSADVKKQILDRVKQGGIPVSQIAQEHGLSETTIYNWLTKGATAPPSWLEIAKLRRENQGLRELIGKLTYEMNVAQKKS